MARHGRARVNPRSPRAFAICDRCGFLVNHFDLSWQMEWQGPRLQNLRLLVCDVCLDIPQENLRTIIIPPDPLPIRDPRPELATASTSGRGGDFSQSEFSTDDFATGSGPPVPPPIPPVPPVSEGIYDEDIYDEGIY